MPLEAPFVKSFAADWSWRLADEKKRTVAFKDLSAGEINSWHWDFGDGETSSEQNPVHAYQKPGNYVVVLDVAGPAGKARRAKVWDVTVK
jgi:PKD repeat protein